MAFTLRSTLAACVLTIPIATYGASPGTQYVAASDGVRIAFEEHGKGKLALVFVHGWSCDHSYWAAQIPEFSKRFRVIALDLGGHGDSGKDRRSDWTIASFGDDVAAVVQNLNLHRVILIGHSMGGDVVTEVPATSKDV